VCKRDGQMDVNNTYIESGDEVFYLTFAKDKL